MERVFVMRQLLWVVAAFVGIGMITPDAVAQREDEKPVAAETRSKSKAKAKKTEGEEEQETAAEAKRNIDKARPGSLLNRDKPLGESIDLRGDMERRRDFEVIRHYTRVAELDVIEGLARKANDLTLLERVEDIRRKELQRYFSVMQLLRDLALQKAVEVIP